MGKPLSMDLRERVLSSVLTEGLSRNQAAARFGVAVSTVVKWVRRYQDTGSLEPGRMGGHKPRKINGAHEAWLLARTRERAFTLTGLVAELAERGLKVDYHSVWDFVRRAGFTYKKRRWLPVSGIAGTSSATGSDG
jgi:putative transposase